MAPSESNSGLTVITGATGHVGANLARALERQGRPTRLLIHRSERGLEGVAGERVRGDVLDPASLARAFAGADVVYHLAAHISFTGGDDGMVHPVNVVGARNVVQACLDQGVRRLVHFSSIHALSSSPQDKSIDETNLPAEGPEFLPYDRTKAAGERAVREGIARGLDAVIVNPTAVLGPHDYHGSAMGEVLLGLARRRFIALMDGGYDWVDVRDVVQGAIEAEASGRTGERYLLGGHWLSVIELARMVEAITGTRAPSLKAPMWLAKLGAPFVARYSRLTGKRPLYTSESLHILNTNSRVSHSKATVELGYTARPLHNTLEDTFAWMREQGLLDGRR